MRDLDKAPISGPELMTLPETAAYLRCGVRTLYGWLAGGGGPPASRVGRRWLFRRSEVDDWLNARAAS